MRWLWKFSNDGREEVSTSSLRSFSKSRKKSVRLGHASDAAMVSLTLALNLCHFCLVCKCCQISMTRPSGVSSLTYGYVLNVEDSDSDSDSEDSIMSAVFSSELLPPDHKKKLNLCFFE